MCNVENMRFLGPFWRFDGNNDSKSPSSDSKKVADYSKAFWNITVSILLPLYRYMIVSILSSLYRWAQEINGMIYFVTSEADQQINQFGDVSFSFDWDVWPAIGYMLGTSITAFIRNNFSFEILRKILL